MATKKAGSAAKKTTRSKSQSKKTTTVTAVKAAAPAKVSAPKLNVKSNELASSFIAEFIGAFALVSAFLITKGEPLYMGFALIGIVLMIGAISGAHVNPVITVGAWVTRRMDHLKTVVYLVAQFLGAGAAFVLMTTFINGITTEGSNLAQPAQEVFKMVPLSDAVQWYVFAAEVLGASIFAFTFAGVYKKSVDRVTRALTVGFGWLIAGLIASVVAGYVSAQIAINPAAAVAASAIDWNDINWMAVAVFIGAPLVGGVIGFFLRDLVESK